jgi:hypothetical protein
MLTAPHSAYRPVTVIEAECYGKVGLNGIENPLVGMASGELGLEACVTVLAGAESGAPSALASRQFQSTWLRVEWHQRLVVNFTHTIRIIQF